MNEFNCNDRCGICCIICSFIPLADDESNEYMNVPRKDKPGKKLVKLKMKYIPDLNQKRWICFYFDPYEKECTIYNNRPKTCRPWNCKSEDYLEQYTGVIEEWNRLKEINKKEVNG